MTERGERWYQTVKEDRGIRWEKRGETYLECQRGGRAGSAMPASGLSRRGLGQKTGVFLSATGKAGLISSQAAAKAFIVAPISSRSAIATPVDRQTHKDFLQSSQISSLKHQNKISVRFKENLNRKKATTKSKFKAARKFFKSEKEKAKKIDLCLSNSGCIP